MTFRFLDISENDEQEFKTQLRIAYNSHFKNTKPFDDVFTDWNVPELSIQNDLYFNDIENVKNEMYESKNNGDEPYMKDFISDLQKNHRIKNHPEGETYQGAVGLDELRKKWDYQIDFSDW